MESIEAYTAGDSVLGIQVSEEFYRAVSGVIVWRMDRSMYSAHQSHNTRGRTKLRKLIGDRGFYASEG